MRILVPLDVTGPCHSLAAEIRSTAMTAGINLQAIDRAGLFALAAIIEHRGLAALANRLGIETAIDLLSAMRDALDPSGMDRAPCLDVPENHDEAPDGRHWAQEWDRGSSAEEADSFETPVRRKHGVTPWCNDNDLVRVRP